MFEFIECANPSRKHLHQITVSLREIRGMLHLPDRAFNHERMMLCLVIWDSYFRSSLAGHYSLHSLSFSTLMKLKA